jgi:MFS superfamily sulfate permease-like transporter
MNQLNMETKNLTVPKTGLAGLKENFKSDALSGFLVFLIALPLCLAISKASGFPPVAGIFTAIIGGLLVSFTGGSQLSIKGPAAGLIVIAIGAVDELGKGDAMMGYRLALAVIFVAGILQVLFGLLRSGALGDFFPSAAVHGMMAAIGLTIIIKQVFVMTGAKPAGKETLAVLTEMPQAFSQGNGPIMLIGLTCLVILFALPMVRNRFVKAIPAPLVVLLVAIPLGRYFDLEHEHTYLFLDHHNYTLGPKFLVELPESLLSAITFPDFSRITSAVSIKYIVMFALVGSLESLLTVKAIDLIDPWKRKANMNRDMIGVGAANALCGLIGGLPMIAEVVRSSANVNNGARTSWANFFHGLFLLVFVSFAGSLIHQIPVAALAAMLIYTGFRLASPKEFVHMFKVGGEQLLIFVVTIIVTLATDLLVGIGAGILTKLVIHLVRGLPLRSVFRSRVETYLEEGTHGIIVNDAAVFSNYLGLKKYLDAVPRKEHVIIDFSNSRLVDHTVQENLERFKNEYNQEGGNFEIRGLEHHKPASAYPTAARVLPKSA